MDDTNSTDQQELQVELFHKLIDKKYDDVKQHCRSHPEGALQKISIYNDTVLHLASRLKENKLVGDLLC